VCAAAVPELSAPPGEEWRAVACHMRAPGSGHSRAGTAVGP
jgi:hypothetical protein